MRWTGPAWLLAIILLPSLAQADPLDSLQRAFETYPDDYATAMSLAQAAYTEGDFALALTAWDAAKSTSNGNLESRLGRVMTLLALGRVAEARQESAAATASGHPDAWLTHAWALRQPNGFEAPVYPLLSAEAAYSRALDAPNAACGRAFTRVELGDTLGTRRTFARLLEDNPSDPCALASSAPSVRFGGGLTGSATLYQDHPTNVAGGAVEGNSWVDVADLLFVGVSGRFLGIGYEDTTIEPYEQGEFWLRLGARHRGVGGQLLVAAVGRSTADTAAPVVAGQVWATFGPTVRLEGSWSEWTDFEAAMFGLGVRVPVLSFLSFDAALNLSSRSTSDDVHPSGSGSVIFDWDPIRLQIGARGGTEVRPVRFDEASVWNTTENLAASAFLDGTVQLNPHLGLTFGYEVARLEPTDGSDARHTHVLTFGVTAEAIRELTP